ncbi:excisionase family DNA binding protein [Streptosporangium album]|uniref:Excisionase family DNA binding protein n=1 Tax=Streptosporangium album TaxID=47479 RepID=A0A7W7WAQ3_9ACTN|nr:helix-turn-helix domain-containing protein [Streptosporangium album]MBB4939374.1 excisionase family DNA binding protein [Streptosporangium album]
MSPKLLTVPQAMAALQVSRWTLYALIRSGELDSVMVNVRCRRIPESALNDYVIRLCGKVA